MNFATTRGLSIVEFLIAIALGALLVAGVLTMFLSNKSTYLIQEALARLQENARFSEYIMNRDLRMAGFQGCANHKRMTVTNLVTNPPSVIDFTNPVQGYEATPSGWSPSLPSGIANTVKAGTDVITVKFASPTGVHLTQNMTRPNTAIIVTNRYGVQAGEYVLITDCTIGDIFVAGANTNAAAITHTVSNNITNDVSKAYQVDAQVMRFKAYTYYIKDTGRMNQSNQTIYALFRMDEQGNEEEIADGVDDLQITYGVDTTNDNTANTYQTADQVNASNRWGQVLSIRVLKLMATVEQMNPTAQSYQYNGESLTPSDKKLRRQWTNLIHLRNRSS